MALSEFTRKLVETKLTEYFLNKIPSEVRDQIKLVFKIRGNNVTLIETRPYYNDPSLWTENPIAQIRYDDRSKKWVLYYADRNSRWHLYPGIKAKANFDDLLKEIDRDPIHIIWG